MKPSDQNGLEGGDAASGNEPRATVDHPDRIFSCADRPAGNDNSSFWFIWEINLGSEPQ